MELEVDQCRDSVNKLSLTKMGFWKKKKFYGNSQSAWWSCFRCEISTTVTGTSTTISTTLSNFLPNLNLQHHWRARLIFYVI
jgi:hypothetical protein